MQARVRLAPQFVVGFKQNVEEAGQILFAAFRGMFSQARALILRRCDKLGLGATHTSHEQVPEMPNGLAAKMLQILAVSYEAVDKSQRAFGGLFCNRLHEIVENAFGDNAEQV